jgi:hypothetical protein
MNIYEEVEMYVRKNLPARERRNKDHAILDMLTEKYPALADVQKELMLVAMREYSSYDRAWRKALEENPELRGDDYFMKDKLMNSKKEELGYVVNRSLFR